MFPEDGLDRRKPRSIKRVVRPKQPSIGPGRDMNRICSLTTLDRQALCPVRISWSQCNAVQEVIFAESALRPGNLDKSSHVTQFNTSTRFPSGPSMPQFLQIGETAKT